ncbi:MAG: diadenylate cyclase [Planctomycetota bacterium]|jgi:diadenylate cyclase|nr:diadenylate cyclase [Planctomycetota bacterium]MDG2142346.1 diadenylate cyclase [Planctomycetota bacterium]
MDTLAWTLQILILTLGIYLFLRFLRSTQGGRIVRGLAIGVPVVVVTIWGTATYLQLAELQFILQNVGGYAVVFIAILFQDELRRGMAQFGENPLVNRFVTSFETDVLEEVSAAALAMATKQESHGSFTRLKPHGGLIVFERESSLKSYINGGRRMDAVVSKDMLESIFQPKSPLHDGAVVIRKDRVAAVSCMLPLTQDLSIAKTTGTRHRAAIGLSEETDAVTLVISEETGKISIATGGKIRQVAQADLINELRDSLGSNIVENRPSFGLRLGKFLKEDLAWFAGSVILGLSILFIARGSISKTRMFSLSIVESTGSNQEAPSIGTLAILLPNETYHLVTSQADRSYTVQATGPIGLLDQLGTGLGGTISMDAGGELTMNVDIDDIHWAVSPPFGVELKFAEGDVPTIAVERYENLKITLESSHVSVNADELDQHFELADPPATFGETTIEITGPPSAIAMIKNEPGLFRLEDIVLTSEDTDNRVEGLRLHHVLVEQGCSLRYGLPVQTTVEIAPVEHKLNEFEAAIVLNHSAPEDRKRLNNWKVKDSQITVYFDIVTRGILPSKGAGTEHYDQEARNVRNYVQKNLWVYVDISGQPEDGTKTRLPIAWRFKDPDWRRQLDKEGPQYDRASLELVLKGEDGIFLEQSPSSSSGD